MNNAIRKKTTFGKITFNKEKGLYKDQYQKAGTVTMELKQVVTTTSYYDVSSKGLSDNPFGADEKPYDSTETRMCWFKTIPEGTSLAQAKKALLKGKLVRHLSNYPIIPESARIAAQRDANLTMEQVIENLAQSQLVCDSNGNPAKDNAGRYQYRVIFWKADENFEDIDDRGKKDSEGNVIEYIPESIITEDQTI